MWCDRQWLMADDIIISSPSGIPQSSSSQVHSPMAFKVSLQLRRRRSPESRAISIS